MHKTWHKMQWLLALLLVLSLVLAGCGGKPAAPAAEPAQAAEGSNSEPAAEEVEPTPVPEAAEEPAEAESGGESTEGSDEITRTLDNLLKLAPLHLASSYETKQDDEINTKGRTEADIDAKGNQHITIYDAGDTATELYVVDKKMYVLIDADSDQYMMLDFEQDDGSSFAFMAMYGGAYLLGFNDLKDAKKVGSESVNGFQCDKYEIKMDLASLGLTGLAADVGGADFQYQGYAWVEPGAKALVKAQADWRTKAADSDVVETIHSEFSVTQGTQQEITAPTNVMALDGDGGSDAGE